MSGIEFLQTTFQGDFAGHWLGLKHQIDNTYKTARLGYGAPGFEIGGFMDEASSKNQFIRYAQFGSFCPIMDNGGGNGAFSFHLPWFHGEDVANIYRYFATLHAELAPYLFSASVDAHLTGESIINNTSFKYESNQLGKWIFVKAITSEKNTVDIQLPSVGSWIDYWTGDKYEAASLLRNREYTMEKYPVFIRSGAIIPMRVTNDITGHGNLDSEGKQTVVIYPDGVTQYTFHRPRGQGVEYDDVDIRVNDNERIVGVDSDIEVAYIFLVHTKGGTFKSINKTGKSFILKY
jgi:alpha-glucosidase (family GH31 glycosyl hydrolase)